MTETLVEMLQRGESRARGYNDYNRYAPRPSGVGHFRGADREIDFSQMTLGEIRDNQRLPWSHPDKLHAVGRYQVIGPTLQEAIEKLDLGRDTRFTPELQDRLLVDFLMREKPGRQAIHDYVTGQPGATLRGAQMAMANEWASVGHPDNGRSVYPNNHASITPAQSAEALQHAREQYAAAISRGASPDDAWRQAAGLGQQPTQTQTHAPQTQVESTQAPKQSSVLKLHSHGPEVWDLQTTLRGLGYTGAEGLQLKVDGDFGNNTDHAVRAFQRAHGLEPVDGKVGKDTRSALIEAAKHPLVSEATHPSHKLYQAIAKELPAGADPKAIANVTLQAMENGITGPDKLQGLAVRGSDVHLQGPYPGARVSVDLTAPTPDLQAMSDHMARQTAERTQADHRQRHSLQPQFSM